MINQENRIKYYKQILLIRMVEESLFDLFSKGKLYGTTHTSIGQEAVAVASLSQIQGSDIVFSNHRCHGHYIAYGGPLEKLYAEIMGKKSGVCGGRGGSQHLCYKNFHTNGIQGGIVPNAVGAAFAKKLKNTSNIAVVFIGDGTLGQGVVYESFNIASLWKIPIFFIIENNQYAMSTHVKTAVSGTIKQRPESFCIKTDEVDGWDLEVLIERFGVAIQYVRENRVPFCQIVNTYRFAPHSKGDDVRDVNEINMWKQKDVLLQLEKTLSEQVKNEIQDEINIYIKNAIDFAEKSSFQESSKLLEINQIFKTQKVLFNKNIEVKKERVLDSLNKALDNTLKDDKTVLLIGEDICDPYGGAFKVTRGLSTKYSSQLINTPISEAGILGIASGLALYGFKPVVEIMFGDFVTLIMDQTVNHLAKYQWMYNDQVSLPVVIRTPMGGRRGYGPTHSQSLEKFFLGIPGLITVAISKVHNAGELLERSIRFCNSPVLFIENKTMYAEHLLIPENKRISDYYYQCTQSLFPTVKLKLTQDENAQISLITYGYNVSTAMEVAMALFIDFEIMVDIIIPSCLSPVPVNEIINFINSPELIVTIEEGTQDFSWGSEIIASLNCIKGRFLNTRFLKIGNANIPIPCNKILELKLVPNKENIIKKVLELINAG